MSLERITLGLDSAILPFYEHEVFGGNVHYYTIHILFVEITVVIYTTIYLSREHYGKRW